jgi:hypothetical protein
VQVKERTQYILRLRMDLAGSDAVDRTFECLKTVNNALSLPSAPLDVWIKGRATCIEGQDPAISPVNVDCIALMDLVDAAADTEDATAIVALCSTTLCFRLRIEAVPDDLLEEWRQLDDEDRALRREIVAALPVKELDL